MFYSYLSLTRAPKQNTSLLTKEISNYPVCIKCKLELTIEIKEFLYNPDMKFILLNSY